MSNNLSAIYDNYEIWPTPSTHLFTYIMPIVISMLCISSIIFLSIWVYKRKSQLQQRFLKTLLRELNALSWSSATLIEQQKFYTVLIKSLKQLLQLKGQYIDKGCTELELLELINNRKMLITVDPAIHHVIERAVTVKFGQRIQLIETMQQDYNVILSFTTSLASLSIR